MTPLEFKEIAKKIKKLSIFSRKCLKHHYSKPETNLLPTVQKGEALDITSELHVFVCLDRFGFELIRDLGPNHGKIEGFFPSVKPDMISVNEINKAFDKYHSKF